MSDRLTDRMVFLVGAQRSGTNWLQRLVGTHPDAVLLPSETQFFTESIDLIAARVQHGVLSSTSTASVYMDRDGFVRAVRAFVDEAFGSVADRLHPDAARIVERSPNHVERLQLIGEVFPDAWVLHIVRDGRDVARSLHSQKWGPTTIADAAELWARSVRSAREAMGGLARYREVRYEDLLADPAGQMRDVFSWLGLAADDDLVARVVAEAGVSYNTDDRIAREKWRSDWGRRELADFERVAGDLIRDLGYPAADVDGGTARDLKNRAAGTARRVQRRLSIARGDGPPPGPRQRPYLPLEVTQRRVDAFCAALAAGDVQTAMRDLAPGASVRVVTAERDDRARGDAGHELLAAALVADPSPWGRQVRGDVHAAGQTVTVVLGHEHGGRTTERLVIFGFDDQQRIKSLVLYRFPL